MTRKRDGSSVKYVHQVAELMNLQRVYLMLCPKQMILGDMKTLKYTSMQCLLSDL